LNNSAGRLLALIAVTSSTNSTIHLTAFKPPMQGLAKKIYGLRCHYSD
jgi:hypothetical protein